MAAYTQPKIRPTEPSALAFHNANDMVDMRTAMEMYEIQVRSFASQTCSGEQQSCQYPGFA